MDNDKKSTEIKRGRGRPSLSPTEKEQRRIEKNKKRNEYHKASGYAAQRKYDLEHKGNYYEPKIRIASQYKKALHDLLSQTGLSLTELFITAAEEKYAVTLSEKFDTNKT